MLPHWTKNVTSPILNSQNLIIHQEKYPKKMRKQRFEKSKCLNRAREKHTRKVPWLPFTDVDLRYDLDGGVMAVDLQPQVMADELLVRRPEPETLRQSLQFHGGSPTVHINHPKNHAQSEHDKRRSITAAATVNP